MGFIEEYKRLERLCGDIMGAERGISAYIDAMVAAPQGAFLVSGWDEDLKQLKHYRWVRNRIAHEPGCTEQNMTTPGDTAWIGRFYRRMQNRTDPLAAYTAASVKAKPAKAVTPRPVARKKGKEPNTASNALGFIAFLLGILLIVAMAYLLSKV